MTLRIATGIVLVSLLHSPLTYGQNTPQAAPRQPARPAPAPAADVVRQKIAAPPAPPEVAVPEVVERGGQPTNIRVEIAVIDQSGTGPAQPKTLTVVVADRANARTRSSFEDRSIDIDTRPVIIDGRIRVSVTVLSNPHTVMAPVIPSLPDGTGPPSQALLNWRNSFTLLLENGKSETALQSFDAAKNRKMSIEVKATIVK